LKNRRLSCHPQLFRGLQKALSEAGRLEAGPGLKPVLRFPVEHLVELISNSHEVLPIKIPHIAQNLSAPVASGFANI
jgi:hypothetical protein